MRWIMVIVILGGCAQDKMMHFTAGAVTSLTVRELTGDPLMGCLAALGLGVAKEIYDSRTHAPDPMDILATGMGCSVEILF